MSEPIVTVLAISGSLRAASINAALLRATAMLATGRMPVVLYTGMGTLPLFNPDLETDLPVAVRQFRVSVTAADALIIASPEYAHGITGVMKNALDWLVSDPEFGGKPVAIFNASPRAVHANMALREILQTMSARIIEPASIAVPLLGAHLDDQQMVRCAKIADVIKGALGALYMAVTGQQSDSTQSFPLG